MQRKKNKVKTLVENLIGIVGKSFVLSEPEELLVYECDGLPHHKHTPLAVVFPSSTEEVSEIVKVLNKAGVSFSPRGAGTGLSGGALAINRGVIIELARMKRILDIDVNNRTACVEVGVINAQLSHAVAQYGLHYAPDPSSQMTCTIGGNIAENSGGIHCLKYGVTTDHVLAVRVVLSDGSIVDLNSNSNGYDLLGVFVGSEGTFGLATEATLKLTFNPPAVRTLLAEFTDINKASQAVSSIIAEGMIPAALEMVDGETIRAVEASVFKAGLPLDSEAALLIELDGLEAGIDEEAIKAEIICKQNGARSVRHALDDKERKKLWAARKSAIGALGRITPDVMLQDAVVPRSRLPEVLAETYRVGAKYNLRVANVFHAGDGNLHPIICFDSRFKDDVENIKEAGREIMQKCVDVGGTITGEHGVGLDKSEYLPLIFSDDDMETMLRVREAFDTTGLCNPGKIIPTLSGCGEKRANVDWSKRKAEIIGSNEILSGHVSAPIEQTSVPHREFNVDDSVESFSSIVGDENARIQKDESVLVFPSSIEETSECLRLTSSNHWSVIPAGAQSWLDVGNALERKEVIISTQRMNRMISHEPADLVATVEAGCSLSDFNRELCQNGQWLPIDPPDNGNTTIGGVVATGIGGPLGFGFGTPRTHILGMRVVLADGRLIKAGGKVVKNVAGYDLCKLFTGSYGSLCLISEVTFKVKPLPDVDNTLAIFSDDFSTLIERARMLINTPLLPAAVELLSSNAFDVTQEIKGKYILLIRFTGSEETVKFQVESSRELFKEYEVEIVKSTIWKSVCELPLKEKGKLIWRVSVLPSQLNDFLQELDNSSIIQAGVGDGRLRVIETIGENRIEKLKTLRRIVNSLMIEHAPQKIKEKIDAFGLSDSIVDLSRKIKKQVDPSNLFSPGRMF